MKRKRRSRELDFTNDAHERNKEKRREAVTPTEGNLPKAFLRGYAQGRRWDEESRTILVVFRLDGDVQVKHGIAVLAPRPGDEDLKMLF